MFYTFNPLFFLKEIGKIQQKELDSNVEIKKNKWAEELEHKERGKLVAEEAWKGESQVEVKGKKYFQR